MATDHNFKVKNGLTVQGETLVVNHTGDLSGTQVYIKKKDSSTNLMRWGEGTVSNADSYRFRIDQTFKFIGNSGSGDNIILNSATGSIQGTSYQIGGTTVISSSRNLTNINNLTATHIHANAGTNYEGLQVSGSNSSYTSASIRNTGSGDAVLYFDASNGDLAGSDYAWIKQSNALNLVLETSGNAGNIQFNPRGSTALRLNTDQSALFSGEVQIDSSADQILTLNQATTGWNYIGFEANGTRKFYLGNDGSDGFVLGSDVANKKFSFSQISELSGVPLITNTSDISIKPAAGQDVLLFNAHNSESQLRLYNNRQDLSNVPVSSIVAYNAAQVSKMVFYRGGGGSTGYIRFQTKYDNNASLADMFQIGSNTSAYGVDVLSGGYRVGGTEVINSSRNFTNLGGAIKSDNTFGFFTNGDAAQNIRTKSVFAGTTYGDTPPAGSFNATNTYELNGTTVIDSSRNLTNIASLTTTGNIQLSTGYNLSWGGAYNAGNPTISAGNNHFGFYPTGNSDGEVIRIDADGIDMNGHNLTEVAAITTTGTITSGGNVDLRRNNNGDGVIIRDVNFLNSFAQGSDDRVALIRAQNQGGAADTRGGKLVFYTRQPSSSGFNSFNLDNTGTVNVTTLSSSGNATIGGNLDVDGIIDNTRNNGNVAAPSTSDHTAGTRIKFYDTSPTAFYAMGIESDTLWFNSDLNYKWYQDAALRMSLMGTHLLMGSANSTGLSSNSIRANGQIDTADVTTGTFRVYNGSTFRGGFGTGQWASGNTGEVANMSLYAVSKLNFHAGNQNDPWFRIETDGTMKSHKNMTTTSGNTTFNVGKGLLGNIHIVTGSGANGAPKQGGITFMGSAESEAQAGLYVINNNSSGTEMTFATTDSYASGPQRALTINNIGNVNLNRGHLQIGGTTVINYSRNLTNIGTIGSSGLHTISGTTAGEILLKLGSATNTDYSDLQMVSNSGVAEFFKTGSSYTQWGGASSFNVYNSNGLIAFHPSGTANVAQIDSGGLVMGNNKSIELKDQNGVNRGFLQAHSSAPHFRISTSGNELIAFYDGTTENIRITGSGDLQLKTGNLEIGSTAVIDQSRSLINIGSISANSSINVDPDNGAGYVASRLRLRSHNDYRGAGVYMYSNANNAQWYTGTPYTDFDASYIIAFQSGVSSDVDQTAQYTHAKFRVNSGGAVSIPSGGSLSVGGDITISGNGEELLFTGGNNRIKFSGYRAMEGTTDGANLYIAETYSNTTVMSNLNISSGHALRHNGNTVVDNARVVYGTAFNGTGYLYTANKALDVLTINHTATPTQYLITTNIPYTSGHHMPTIKIQGFAYGNAETVDITICWYIYNGNFTSYSASSSGSWAPAIHLAQNSSGKVVIHLAEGHYYTKMSVSVESGLNMMSLNRDHMASWSWSDAACPNSNKVAVPYKQKLPGETELNGGKLYFASTNYGVGAGGHNLNSVYVDTLESGSSTDPLELVYYQGNRVNIGASGGSKPLGCSQVIFGNTTSRSISHGTGYNNHNAVKITGNWNEFECMGRVLDVTDNNCHFMDGYGSTNHASHYLRIGSGGGGNGGLDHVHIGCDLNVAGNVTAYYSDARLKQNVETIPNALEILKGIRGVTFEWNELAETVWAKKQGDKDFGMIAQEVDAVFPMGTIVQGNADRNKELGYADPESPNYDPLHNGELDEPEYKTIKYDKMVTLAIQAIKEQQEKIEKLEELVQKLISEK